MMVAWIALMAALWMLVIVLALALLGLGRRLAVLETGSGHGTPSSPRPAAAPVVGALLPSTDALGRLRGSSAGGVILFVSSTCNPCRVLIEDLGRSWLELPGQAELVVVTDRGGVEECQEIGASEVIVDADRNLIQTLSIPATPYAIAISPHGHVLASDYASKRPALERVAAALDGLVRPSLV